MLGTHVLHEALLFVYLCLNCAENYRIGVPERTLFGMLATARLLAGCRNTSCPLAPATSCRQAVFLLLGICSIACRFL